MSKQIIHTDKAPKPFAGYSQGVKSGGFVFVSGQGPIDPATGQVHGATIQEQTGQCLHNVAAVLEAAGSSLDKVVSATFFLAEGDDYAGMNEEWGRWFPLDPPARQGSQLATRLRGIKISIAAIAEA